MAVAALSSSSDVADEAAPCRGAGEGKPAAGDAGAAFVLESKGTWWHAGFHLTTAMVGPAVLSLPYALRGIGWALGLATLTALAAVSFYTYYVMSRVLDHCEAASRRHIRFRDLAADVLGSGWAFYLMVAVQGAINVGVTIGSILLAGNSLQIMYTSLVPDGPLKLYHFIIAVASVLALLSQMPSFHSLRFINLGSLVLSVGYTILVSAACIRAGLLSNAPAKDYSLSTSKSEKTFDAFLSVSILAAAFGNGILPEIQATLVPPAAGKMVKALVINYSVAFFTFYPLAITGYWAFGKTVQSNAIQSLMPDTGPSLAPRWLLCLTVVLVLFQLLAIALLYAQVVYEVMEKRVADATRGRFSWRNLLPRVAMRTLYVALCAFVAAALPFFGEIVGVIGAVGYIPLDFILPVVMYNMVVSPPRRSVVYMTNVAIMVLFTGLGVIGAVASVRKLVLNAGRFKLFNDHVFDLLLPLSPLQIEKKSKQEKKGSSPALTWRLPARPPLRICGIPRVKASPSWSPARTRDGGLISRSSSRHDLSPSTDHLRAQRQRFDGADRGRDGQRPVGGGPVDRHGHGRAHREQPVPRLAGDGARHDPLRLLRRQAGGGGGGRGRGVRAGVQGHVVARGVPPHHRHGGPDGAHAAVRAAGHGVGARAHGAHRRRRRHLLHLLPHVPRARPLRGRRPPPHPLPRARRRRPRVRVGVLRGGHRADRHQRRHHHRQHPHRRQLPPDYVREFGAGWYPQAVPLHHHRRRCAVALLADAVIPLAAVYQPRVPSPSLRLHHPRLRCVHSGRYDEQCSGERLLAEPIKVREDVRCLPLHLHPGHRVRQRHPARDPGHTGTAGCGEDDQGVGALLHSGLLHLLPGSHLRLLGLRQHGAVQRAAEPDAGLRALTGADVAARARRRARPPSTPGHRTGVLTGGVRDHGEGVGGRGPGEVLMAEPGAAGGAADLVRCGVRVCGGGAAVLRRHRGRGRRRGVHPARLRAPRRHVQHGVGPA